MSAHESSAPESTHDDKRILEALIFVSDDPVTVEQIGQVLRGRAAGEVRQLIDELDRDLAESGRALRVEEVAGGFRFSTRSDLAPWIRLHFRNRNRTRLSTAGIETLAVIAYKQPVTSPEIQEIRGVDSQGPIRTLLDKRLVRTAGRKKVVGRPFLYATTREFLMHFGLASIDDLPPIEDFERMAGSLGSTGSLSEPGEQRAAGGEEAADGMEDTDPGTSEDAPCAASDPEAPLTAMQEGPVDVEGAGEIEGGFVASRAERGGAARVRGHVGSDEEE